MFQDRRLEGRLSYTSQGGIESTDFLVLVVIAFALSTDYEVFLMTRIKEARDAGSAIAGDHRRLAANGADRLRRFDPARGHDRRVRDLEADLPEVARARRGDRRAGRRLRRQNAPGPIADGAARTLELVAAGTTSPPARQSVPLS
jgi:hypothetical protein